MTADLSTCIAAIAPVTGIIVGPLTCHQCQPHRWDDEGRWVIYEYAEARPVTMRWAYGGDLIGGDIKAGDVNCRDKNRLTSETDDRCAALMRYSDGGNEKLFMLNPSLGGDCSKIKYNTPYCTDGFLEPLRAHDGFCGPPHKNATCIGVDLGPCCNSETWTCGKTLHDCARGVCYEGACWGHKRFTTDGTCGSQNQDRKCAGKWGDCCSIDGKCGTGPDFCGIEKCQSGNCEGQGQSDQQDSLL
ncbi:hypothetical protein NLG97_g2910 [Lecanicillium saksenae]|uniref:Uncharacterized protein n=1 Tax=Lecanicillium saksenae TaxID=468837 RepID=A0ACC1R1D1_9HYPO|nr:hypothetical protein NLG97_g2910 [Lecanicillium saksenae]